MNINDHGISIGNFRDMGGTACGARVVKNNLLFRSPCLTGLTVADKKILDGLALKYIVDFRSKKEATDDPDYIPSGAAYMHLSASQSERKLAVQPSSVADMVPRWLPSKICIEAFRLRFKILYKHYPFNNKAYKKLFELMDSGESLLFHCSAGKDRTGVAAMLVLLALGADFEVIMRDYLLSNELRTDANEQYVALFANYPHFEKLKKIFKVALSVSADLLQISYNAILRKYKTVENYFLHEFGADAERIARWRSLYTCAATALSEEQQ